MKFFYILALLAVFAVFVNAQGDNGLVQSENEVEAPAAEAPIADEEVATGDDEPVETASEDEGDDEPVETASEDEETKDEEDEPKSAWDKVKDYIKKGRENEKAAFQKVNGWFKNRFSKE